MKKLLITLLLAVFLMTGCNVVSSKSVTDVFETILYVSNNLSNTYMEGYSLYLPQGIKLIDKSDYNLVIQDKKNKYYLYIDLIAYYYKTDNLYEEKNSHFYSKKISYNNKNGYIDVVENNNNYFVTLMYNYAKIESVIKKEDFNDALVSMCSILSTIKYNDNIIDGMVGREGMVFQEERFNLFESSKENDNFLKYENEYGTYKSQIKINEDDVIDIEESVE